MPHARNAASTKHTERGRFKTGESDPIVHRLQLAIEDSGMSATQVAAKALTSYQTVQKIIDGDTRLPRNSTRDRIFEACGIVQKFYKKGKLWRAEE